MGNTQAFEFAELVSQGDVNLRVALHWHLTANHFPAIDPVWVNVAVEAIEAANGGFYDTILDRPVDYIRGGLATITVEEVIEGLHLEAFTDTDWD